MKIQDAANILGITGGVTPEIVKQAFRKAAKLYHPDVNPAGENMMKIINAAFDVLKDFTGEISDEDTETRKQTLLSEAPYHFSFRYAMITREVRQRLKLP